MRHGSSCGCADCLEFHPDRFDSVSRSIQDREALVDNIVRQVAKDWREYGTPTMGQCAKVAKNAIEAYVRRMPPIRAKWRTGLFRLRHER